MKDNTLVVEKRAADGSDQLRVHEDKIERIIELCRKK